MTPLASPEAFAALAKILEERGWTRALAEPQTPLGRLSCWWRTDTGESLIVAVKGGGIEVFLSHRMIDVNAESVEDVVDGYVIKTESWDLPAIGPITATLAEPPKVEE